MVTGQWAQVKIHFRKGTEDVKFLPPRPHLEYSRQTTLPFSGEWFPAAAEGPAVRLTDPPPKLSSTTPLLHDSGSIALLSVIQFPYLWSG